MHKAFMVCSATIAALSVALGAFAAHRLKNMVSAQSLEWFDTGVRYQMYHAFALAIVALLYKEIQPTHLLQWAGISFIAGIICFSGSLYVLCFAPHTSRWIWPVTPLGGLLFIAGWILIIVAILKH